MNVTTFGEPGVTYRPIPSEPGYFAGDDGSVWSLKGKEPLKRKPGRSGKRRDRLYISFARPLYKLQLRQVPHLVLEAFVGPMPPGLECCHDDGDSLNNRPGNLRWDTHQANMDDRKRHGTPTGAMPGEANTNAVATAEIIREVMALVKAGVRQAEVIRRLGLPRAVVYNATSGYTWNHITGLPLRRPKRGRGRPKKVK